MRPLNSNWFIRARLKHRHLLMLAALGETANLNTAAIGLGISQPALSKLLKELEEGLGVELFERHARGVLPTVYGETMIRYARHLLTTLDNAFEEVNAIRQGLSGHVRLGTILTPCTDLIPATIRKIRSSYPKLEISIRTGSSEELLGLLEDGELDLLIARHQRAWNQSGFQYEAVSQRPEELPLPAREAEPGSDSALQTYPEPAIICARPQHPLIAAALPLELPDLLDQEWALPPNGSLMRAEFEAIFHRAGCRPPRHIVTAENLLMITSLLEHNAMLTLLPYAVMSHYRRHGLLAPVPLCRPLQHELNRILEPYGLIHKGEDALSPASRAVLQLLRETCHEQPPGCHP